MAKKRKMTPKTKLFLLRAAEIVVTFAPIIIAVYSNRKVYFATKTAGISLTAGGVVAVIIVVLAMLGKGKKIFGSGMAVTGIVFFLSILLEPMLLNFQFLSGMLFAGEAAATVLIKPKVKKLERMVQAKENAKALKEELYG